MSDTLSFTRRISDLGQIAIPKDIRRKLRINANDPLEITCTDSEIRIIPKTVEEPLIHSINYMYETLNDSSQYADILDNNTRKAMLNLLRNMEELVQEALKQANPDNSKQ